MGSGDEGKQPISMQIRGGGGWVSWYTDYVGHRVQRRSSAGVNQPPAGVFYMKQGVLITKPLFQVNSGQADFYSHGAMLDSQLRNTLSLPRCSWFFSAFPCMCRAITCMFRSVPQFRASDCGGTVQFQDSPCGICEQRDFLGFPCQLSFNGVRHS